MKLNRRQLRKLLLKEQSDGILSNSSDINKQLAIEMLENIIRDLQHVPQHNFDKYIQHLINFQIPNIVRTLKE